VAPAARHATEQVPRSRNKGGHPTTPRAVSGEFVERRDIEVRLDDGDVVESARATSPVQCVEKAPRAIDGDDASFRTNDLREIECRVARAAADVDQRLANGEAGALPRRQCARSPDTVLQPESLDLFVVRSENVVAVVCGHVVNDRRH